MPDSSANSTAASSRFARAAILGKPLLAPLCLCHQRLVLQPGSVQRALRREAQALQFATDGGWDGANELLLTARRRE
jgi:hypothetical protein